MVLIGSHLADQNLKENLSFYKEFGSVKVPSKSLEPHGVAELRHLITHACSNPGKGLRFNLSLNNGQNIGKLGFAGHNEHSLLLMAGSFPKARLVGRDHIFNSLHSLLIASICKLYKLCLQRANLSPCLGNLGFPVLLLATRAPPFLEYIG